MPRQCQGSFYSACWQHSAQTKGLCSCSCKLVARVAEPFGAILTGLGASEPCVKGELKEKQEDDDNEVPMDEQPLLPCCDPSQPGECGFPEPPSLPCSDEESLDSEFGEEGTEEEEGVPASPLLQDHSDDGDTDDESGAEESEKEQLALVAAAGCPPT